MKSKENKPEDWYWYCCGRRRGPAELQCPFCGKTQPNVDLPRQTILLNVKPNGN